VIRCAFDFQNPEHLSLYQDLINEHREKVDFWSFRDIHLTPESFSTITWKLSLHGVAWEIIISNVQDFVDKERIPSSVDEVAGLYDAPNPDPFFDTYRDFATINDWVKNQAAANPTLMTVTQLNNTYQNRSIVVARITNGAKGVKPVIFYEGGIHAREWIAHATVCYIIGKLLNQSDPDARSLLDTFEFQIVPIVNGDGYVYTWTNQRDWRKTRKPNAGSNCIGTDPNRNWNNHWCQQGASTDPCSDSYCGSAAWSEPEVLTMSNHITNTLRTQQVRVFIDWHAYGQLWMAPYGWSCTNPPDYQAQQRVGTLATQAIRSTNNLIYRYGTICNIIYPASGSSADWAYENSKIIYSYGVELRDTGANGFLLPASQIRPQGEEIWAATVAVAKAV